MGKEQRRLHRLFEGLGRKLPFAAGFLDWVRRPSSRWIRIPLSLILIFGGIFSFLPVLGIWMLPLGLLMLALDLPFLRGPVNRLILWGQRKLALWRRSRRDRKAERAANSGR
jgi:hypothetical protein